MSVLKAKMKIQATKLLLSVTPIGIPETLKGQGCTAKVGGICKKNGLKKILIVTDEILSKLGLLESLYTSLSDSGVSYVLFDKVMPDPSANICVEGSKIYISEKCDSVLAFGGGSSMDAAKFISILVASPGRDPKSLRGTLQMSIFTKLPTLIAIPTTAGTGAETTVAAVISWPEEKAKFSIADPRIVPKYAVLDPLLIKKLPKAITAATGMDALTHAVESYVSVLRSKLTSDYSLRSIKNVFDYLPRCYSNGDDLVAREKMLIASFDAGVAFTRVSVGYVHAIAHQLGALFHVPHGVANAMLLHRVLKFYLAPPTNDYAIDGLAKMGLVIENRGHEEVKKEERDGLAQLFVDRVEQLASSLDIPLFVKGFEPNMVEEVATRAIKEAHADLYDFYEAPMQALMDPGYPVPKYMTVEECKDIAGQLVDPNSASKL